MNQIYIIVAIALVLIIIAYYSGRTSMKRYLIGNRDHRDVLLFINAPGTDMKDRYIPVNP